MAPYTTESARPLRSRHNRLPPSLPRVTPAIPLAFSKTPPANQPAQTHDPQPVAIEPQPIELVAALNGCAAGDEQQETPADEPPMLVPDSGKAKGEEENRKASTDESLDVSPVHALAHLAGEQLETVEDSEKPQATNEYRPGPAPAPTNDLSQELPKENSQPPYHKIPYELPPPFYPSDHVSTPMSATSSYIGQQQQHKSSAGVPMHHPRPSTSSLVFGGLPDSSSSSPVPPSSAGLVQYPPPPPPPPAPGYGGVDYPMHPFVPHGHAHHYSEPHARMIYDSISMPPPAAYGHKYPPMPTFDRSQPWFPSTGHVPYRMGPNESYISHHPSISTNGHVQASRSPSNASLKTQGRENSQLRSQRNQVSHSDLQDHMRIFTQVQNSSVSSSAPSLKAASQTEDVSGAILRDYLCSQFGSRDLADYILELSLDNATGFDGSIPVHGLIIARSPILRSLMAPYLNNPGYQGSGFNLLRLSSSDKHLDGYVFMDALKHLYGGPLLNLHNLSLDLQLSQQTSTSSQGFGIPQQHLAHALAYMAAGHLLQVPAIIGRGLDVAKALLRWETIEKALSFGLDGGLDPSWYEGNGAGHAPGNNQTGLVPMKHSPSSSPTYGHYSTSFLREIIDFMAYDFPQEFEFQRSASQLTETSRLPHAVEPRPSSSNPRLSMIQFGAVPLEDNALPNPTESLLSRILLSLPFPILKALLQHYDLGARLGWPRIVEIMRAVIEEREKRRAKVLKSKGIAAACATSTDGTYQNLQWEERVEPSNHHESGFEIGRYWKGISTTTANGASKS